RSVGTLSTTAVQVESNRAHSTYTRPVHSCSALHSSDRATPRRRIVGATEKLWPGALQPMVRSTRLRRDPGHAADRGMDARLHRHVFVAAAASILSARRAVAVGWGRSLALTRLAGILPAGPHCASPRAGSAVAGGVSKREADWHSHAARDIG